MKITQRPGGGSAKIESETGTHQSLALPALYRGLRTGTQKILDLGPAIGPNVAFFGRLPCSLFIADLHESLFPGTSDGAVRRNDSFEELLGLELPDDGGFDLVLAWDLLNYLDQDEISALSRRLADVCSGGAVLFAMITTRRVMPNKPTVFRILAPDRLSYRLESGVKRAAPMYKEPDLGRIMPDFGVESTFLLRNGMQEYLFSRHASA
ncbi:MAG: hypothetical protein OEM62_11770 [Acidobacteriota bacterium]|nr:hypothetical protein [Acidobacteriota bacterium]